MQRIVANIFNRVLGRRGDSPTTNSNLNEVHRLPCMDFDDRPHARSGHRIFTDDDYVYVVGGYYSEPNDGGHIFKEVWRYNILTKCWSQVYYSSSTHFPEALASHAVVSVLPFSPHIICFGGSQIPFGQTNSQSIFLLSILQNRISSVELEQTCPYENGIYGHAMCSSKTESSVFYSVGGTTGHDYYLDVYKLTLVSEGSCQWKRLDRRNTRRGRYRLEIEHDEVNNRLFLLGGGAPDFAEGFDQITVFNLATNLFEIVNTIPDEDEFPLPRRSHSLVRYGRFLVIAGGCAPAPEPAPYPLVIRDDVWRLDMDTLQWKNLGRLVEAVYFHDATVTSDGLMIIWGGVTSPDSVTRTAEGQAMWLGVPDLKTLAAQQLARNYPEILSRNVEELRITNMKGIFKHLLNNVYIPDQAAPAS